LGRSRSASYWRRRSTFIRVLNAVVKSWKKVSAFFFSAGSG